MFLLQYYFHLIFLNALFLSGIQMLFTWDWQWLTKFKGKDINKNTNDVKGVEWFQVLGFKFSVKIWLNSKVLGW